MGLCRWGEAGFSSVCDGVENAFLLLQNIGDGKVLALAQWPAFLNANHIARLSAVCLIVRQEHLAVFHHLKTRRSISGKGGGFDGGAREQEGKGKGGGVKKRLLVCKQGNMSSGEARSCEGEQALATANTTRMDLVNTRMLDKSNNFHFGGLLHGASHGQHPTHKAKLWHCKRTRSGAGEGE